MLLQTNNVSLTYKDGKSTLEALRDVNLQLPEQGFFGLLGPSGSGKTSLLYILSGIRRPTQGTVFFAGKELPASTGARNKLRRAHMGFVFQLHFLMNYLTVIENIMVGTTDRDKRKLAPLLERLGLQGLEKRYPYQLSGGQRQRVAIARAVANHPQVLFVDEPTASLDYDNAQKVIALLQEMSEEACIIVVTHDPSILSGAGRILHIQNGSLREGVAA
jgi:putative ABC transport system ATP-binding protein